MTPDFDERIASVIRALSDVVMPALPAEAGLAREQVELSIGHLRILRAQIDGGQAFEVEELADAVKLSEELMALGVGASLSEPLAAAGSARFPKDIRAARVSLHEAIHALMPVIGRDPAMVRAVMMSERSRVVKDRAWFAPFGFDVVPTEA